MFTPPSAALLSVESRTETELALALYGWPRISTAGRLLWPSDLRARGRVAVDVFRRRRYGSTPGKFPIDLVEGGTYAVGLRNDGKRTGSAASSVLDDVLLDGLLFDAVLPSMTEELNQAVDATFVPYAWAVWFQWHGDIELIGLLGRSGARTLEDTYRRSPELRITVTTLGDPERFASVDDFRSNLTTQAKTRLESARVLLRDPDVEVDLTIARTRDRERPWIKKAVVLEVTAATPGPVQEVTAIRDSLRVAVNRGKMAGGNSGRTGEGLRQRDQAGAPLALGGGPETLVEKRMNPYVVLFVVVACFYVVFASSLLQVFGWGGQLSLVVNLVVGAFAGAIVGLIYVYSGVEVRGTARLRRAYGLGKVLVGAFLGVLVPYGVKLIVKRYTGIDTG
jgi:hypothetical protein